MHTIRFHIARLIGSLTVIGFLLSAPAQAAATPSLGIGVSIRIGPPILPVYAQPICPGAGYIWTPGYWAYGDDGYYWVPGVWVLPPSVGLLWTPGYWGFANGLYLWNAGYWGPTVGFYGGINYGFGYTGTGFYGGYWRGGQYYYNTRVTNVNRTVIHNVYNTTVVNRGSSRVAYNGGPHGIQAHATSAQLAAAHERRAAMTSEQTRHQETARGDRALLASVNHGRPDVAAVERTDRLNANARREAPARATNNARAAETNRSNARPTPEPRERSEARRPEPAAKPAPTHTERPGVHESAPAHSNATHSRTSEEHAKPPAATSHVNRSAERPATTERARPTHAPEHRTAPAAKPETSHSAPKPATHESAPKPAPSHVERPATHESAPKPASHPAEQHASRPASTPHNSAPHASQPHQSAPKPEAHPAPAQHSEPASKPERDH
jgi:hypothetical protein